MNTDKNPKSSPPINIRSFTRTDLALETDCDGAPGVKFRREKITEGELYVTRIDIISREGERALGRKKGKYISIEFTKPPGIFDELRENIVRLAYDALCELLSQKIPEFENFSESGELLIVGLGNRSMTPDALGSLAAEQIIVTRHLRAQNETAGHKNPFSKVRCAAAIVPGVLGQTGIETLEIVRSVVKSVSPCAVIAIDSLAARSPDRLCRVIQLCDTGVSPGSGVGCGRSELSFETLGVPVISMGVPTVIDSSTLIYDALERAGASESINEPLQRILKNGRSFFVSPKDIDAQIKTLAAMTSDAVNHMLLSDIPDI